MIVTIEMQILPIQLRSIIGDRSLMQDLGPSIIKSLLHGYVAS
jgi:hypothetical protein